MTRVLLINSDRREAIDRLLADPEVDLCVITKPKYAALYAGARVAEVGDVADLTQVRDAALRLARDGWFDCVISPLERGLISAGLVRSQLGIAGLSFDRSLAFASKLVMKDTVRAAGIPVAGYRAVASMSDLLRAGDELGWPVIVKSSVGAGAQNTTRIVSAAAARTALSGDAALRALAEQPSPVLVERALDVVSELHCDAVVQQGVVRFASVSRYLAPVLDTLGGLIGSVILETGDPMRKAVLDLHARVTAALGLRDGVTHLEAFETPDGLMFGEVTCRPGGGGIIPAIEHKYGVDLWSAFIALHLNRDVHVDPVECAGTVGWVGLPARNGRVTAITGTEELRSIPGVTDVAFRYQVGDVIDDKRTSVFLAGSVYFRVPAPELVPALVARVADCYRIRTVRCGAPSR